MSVTGGPAGAAAAGQAPADHDRELLIRQVELVISQVLRGGVLLSAAIIGIGVVWFYWRYLMARGPGLVVSDFPHTLGGVGTGLVHGDPLAVIALGLLILLATPIVRVAVSIVAFAVERDWTFVVVTGLVLLILLVSFFLGRGGA